ncbi:hypothetical protein BDV38DRAFT_283753 [Aspergillus pseudotamarii]|uniref:Uncharacterized protein n=1 Tax=Aspergillus pseudotamarii TaxID=132259 RepID=A0A5N6SPC2_ASPPS|nr:uncharacterized protein BDV38DRAFT_283753 [Aspergillus pseudotamarii]KAE8136538.1 hypothetical protein BDV38DRAFT_283753 [Aspergillus pseudotamarii]
MSLTYPEGECFFKRAALTTSTYTAEKPGHFYAHIIVEYIWNRPAFYGPDSLNKYDLHYHPRAAYKAVKGDLWDSNYGNWDSISLLYGKKPYNDRYRHAKHDLCVSGNRFRDQEKGGSLESWFMVMPMPLLVKGEEWVLIDRTACIRAIYIPVAQQTSEDYPELCTFLQVSFAIRRDASIMTYPEIWNADGRNYIVVDREETFPLDPTLGLLPDGRWALAINIRKLVNLLSLPRQLRGHDCFSSRSIVMVDRKLTPTTGAAQNFSSSADLSWTTVAGANYGLSLQWKPPQATMWLADFIKNSLTVAIGFIPVIGPLAAVCFPLAWTAIADPASFENTLRSLIPIADLAFYVSEEIKKSAKEQKVYLPEGWATNAGGVFGFAPSVARSGTQPATQPATTLKQAPVKPPAPEVVKKIESIRNFKYWSLMKPVSATAAAPTTTKSKLPEAAAPPSIKTVKEVSIVPEVPLKAPPKLSLDELKPSASFQLAGQALLNSGDTLAVTGSEDDVVGEILEEILPHVSGEPEEPSVNIYDWLNEYFGEDLDFEEEEGEGEEEDL